MALQIEDGPNIETAVRAFAEVVEKLPRPGVAWDELTPEEQRAYRDALMDFVAFQIGNLGFFLFRADTPGPSVFTPDADR